MLNFIQRLFCYFLETILLIVSVVKRFIIYIQVAQPVDVRKLVGGAYGKYAVWWPNHEKGKVVTEDLGLKGLAELALEGVRLEKKPSMCLLLTGAGLQLIMTMMKKM